MPARADDARRIPGCTVRPRRRGGSTARRCCCWAPGPGRSCSSSPIRAVAAGVADHSDFRADPWRRLAGTLRSFLTIVYGTTGAAAGRDPPPQYAPSRDHRTGLRGARPRAQPVGPRDARRLDDRGRRRLARAAPGCAPAPRSTRRLDRSAERSACPTRCSRPTSRRSSATWRTCSRPAGPVRVSAVARELAGVVLRPPLGPLAAMAGGRSRPTRYAWTLWPSVGLLPASVRDDYGLAWGPRERLVVGLARGRLARLAPAPAPLVPPDAAGAGRGPPDATALSRAAGSAARTACGRDRAASPRRGRRATHDVGASASRCDVM